MLPASYMCFLCLFHATGLADSHYAAAPSYSAEEMAAMKLDADQHQTQVVHMADHHPLAVLSTLC